jgi:ATPase subunit of ABC transporter with duplicated ATPase domains
MLDEIIQKVLDHHDDFSYEDVHEICEDFLQEQPVKIKEETKLKRLNKFLEKEFELNESHFNVTQIKEYSLETIPKYLFAGKTQFAGSLISINGLTKNIEQTKLFENAELKINRDDKVALI